MFPFGKANFLAIKKMDFGATAAINSRGKCVGFGEGRIWLLQGGCGYVVMMLTMEAVGNGGGGRVEVFGGGGQGERTVMIVAVVVARHEYNSSGGTEKTEMVSDAYVWWNRK